MTGITKYIPMRRCMNCDHATESLDNKCPMCGYMFVQQATEDEIAEYKAKWMVQNDQE